MYKIEHNVETGEIKQIELSPEEIIELEQQYAQALAAETAAQAEAESQATAKAALLAQLGITEEQAKLLLS
jgi:predicted metal-binding transcription factor (methanogenesis marker protein 9)